MQDSSDLRLAVLIDAENVPTKRLREIMEEIAVYGNATIKRIYGDWTTPNLSGWKSALLEHAITPIQQYGYTSRKNSTDSAMIIDAMDVLYSGKVDGFCIVSSDSDFTRLATRLREAGMKVIGIGEKKTPNPFIVACDKFVYIEVIGAKKDVVPYPPENADAADAGNQTSKRQAKIETAIPDAIVSLIKDTIADLADDEGWAFLGEVGTLLIKKQPDFDPRNHGFPKLTPLIKSIGCFDIDVRQTNFPHIKHIFIKNRKC